jgi:hypothetical protein
MKPKKKEKKLDEQTEKERKAFKRNPDLSYNTRVIHQLSWADFA